MSTERHLDSLLSLPALSGAVISPDEKTVAWSWSRIGPAADVFAVLTDGSAAPVRLTETPDDTLVVSWTPDGGALVVAEDRDGDERVQLSLVRLAEPGELEPLTEPSPDYYIRGGQIHPNRRWLVYGANLDTDTEREIEATWVYRQDLKTGERLPLARPENSGSHGPQLNAPGDRVLYYRSEEHPSGRQVWLVDIEGKDDREILNLGPTAKVSASWFPDGRRILFVAEAKTHRRLGLWSFEDESVRWLIDDPSRDIEHASVLPSGGAVVVVETEQARLRASLLDPDGAFESQVLSSSGSLVPLASVDGAVWAGLHYSARQPNDLVCFDPSDVEVEYRSLTCLWKRTSLEREALAAAEDFRWNSVDGLEIQGWLYRAREPGGTVVLVHGGPTSHSEDRFNAQVQYFVSCGFNVFSPNYRGSTGFGLPFQEAIKEDGWGGREQEDIRSGIEALIAARISEPGRVGVTGTSYGGYSAWWAITRYPPEIVAAAAPVCGMTDLALDYHSTRPDLRPYSREMMGGGPDELPTLYRERSPVHCVENIRGKLLIVQGLKDPNVTPENVRVVTKELDRHGIPYELLAFRDEGHGIARPRNLGILYSRMARFFRAAFV